MNKIEHPCQVPSITRTFRMAMLYMSIISMKLHRHIMYINSDDDDLSQMSV